MLLAALFATSPHAESDWPDFPASLEMVIDEPVFGGRAWVLEAGRGHERSVVLVHGLGEEASQSWRQVMPELVRDYHVVVFDLPGFGRSTRANELYNPERYAAFIDFVVSRYVDGRFALVGHSMGGAIALRYAAAHSEKVDRLVLVDAGGILHRAAFTKALALSGIDQIPDTLPGQGPLSRWVGGVFSKTAGASEITVSAEEMILNSPEGRQRFFAGDPNRIAGYVLLLEDFSRWIPLVSMPTLVIWGEGDAVTPLRTGKMLAGNIAGTRLEVIPGGRHSPMKFEPGRFLRILAEFLAIPPGDFAAGTTGGLPYALDPMVSWQSERVGRCEDNSHRQVFTGEFERIVVKGCEDVLLQGVRARKVQITDSLVEIENSVIRSDGTALRVVGSLVKITAGHLEGTTAVTVEHSRLDIAGTVLIGERSAVEVPESSTSGDAGKVLVLFSVSRVESPEMSGYLHGPRTVSAGRPL